MFLDCRVKRRHKLLEGKVTIPGVDMKCVGSTPIVFDLLSAQKPWCFVIHSGLIAAQMLRLRNSEGLVSKPLHVRLAHMRTPVTLFLGFPADGEEGHSGIMIEPPLHQYSIHGYIFLPSTIGNVDA